MAGLRHLSRTTGAIAFRIGMACLILMLAQAPTSMALVGNQSKTVCVGSVVIAFCQGAYVREDRLAAGTGRGDAICAPFSYNCVAAAAIAIDYCAETEGEIPIPNFPDLHGKIRICGVAAGSASGVTLGCKLFLPLFVTLQIPSPNPEGLSEENLSDIPPCGEGRLVAHATAYASDGNELRSESLTDTCVLFLSQIGGFRSCSIEVSVIEAGQNICAVAKAEASLTALLPPTDIAVEADGETSACPGDDSAMEPGPPGQAPPSGFPIRLSEINSEIRQELQKRLLANFLDSFDHVAGPWKDQPHPLMPWLHRELQLALIDHVQTHDGMLWVTPLSDQDQVE